MALAFTAIVTGFYHLLPRFPSFQFSRNGMNAATPPPWFRPGIEALCALDRDFSRIEPAAGPLPWRWRPRGFAGLTRTVLGQQISNQAAEAIWRRFAALPGALEPASVLRLTDEQLRAAGLSRPKVAHLRSLAAAALDGALRLEALSEMGDAEAIAHLAAQRGLGPWTAQVHLLFAEGRPDVFPHGDVALAASLAHLKGLPERPAPRALTAMAEGWSPWRSLAARLLWHHWRHVTGRPVGESD
jgi:DNA-3-methyladenine glycosylase II